MYLYDVIVVGGGIAGCVAAMELVRSGFSVAILDGTARSWLRVGETVQPELQAELRELGLWEAFLADQHLPSSGLSCSWGDEELRHTDHLFNPYGKGWHLDRVRFDRMLAVAAKLANAAFFSNCVVLDCFHEGAALWTIKARQADSVIAFSARFVIDASGRHPSAAHQSSAKLFDHMVALLTFGRCERSDHRIDSRALIEAGAEGWWYSAILPDEHFVLAYMTDAYYFRDVKRDWIRIREAALAGSRHTAARFSTLSGLQTNLCLVAANTMWRQAAGCDWLAVGEALFAFDPLCGQGILFAIRSARQAAACIREENPEALDDYARWAENSFRVYLTNRLEYYSLESRWNSSEFWKTRQKKTVL